jgi:hypothetical protein
MVRTLLKFVLFTLAVPPIFGASTISYRKDGSVDSINLDLRMSNAVRRKDGALVLDANGIIEHKPVRLKLLIGNKWTVWKGRSEPPGIVYQASIQMLPDGEESSAFDDLVKRSFKRNLEQTLFCPTGYVALTNAHREDLERRKVRFFASDAGLCAGFTIQVGLDLREKSVKIAIFEEASGRTYPDRVE